MTRLVEKRFFDTIFTTNFDDLINESFHQFSEVRPIVCAHDSSIRNVTFTSHRPKIIKLHGDYLFDDIKTTLRETETLERNTRDKFIELSKEVGLIVLGFAGNDRSIMDVLEFLAKDESYLKNGIYWCIRKEDNIGENLRKFLWNDKVFWVEIEGFDQFFAELYSRLIDNNLPVNTSSFNEHNAKIFDKYLSNEILQNSECQIIKDHLTKLEKEKSSNIITDLIKSLNTSDSSEEDMTNTYLDDQNIQILLKIKNLEKGRKFRELISYVNKELLSVEDNNLKEKLLNYSFDAAQNLFDDSESLKIINKLIEIDSRDSSYYRLKAHVIEDLDEKLDILSKAIKQNPFSSSNYLDKAEVLITKSSIISETESEKYVREITDLIDNSLKINPSISNNAWKVKFNYTKDSNLLDKDEILLKIINNLKVQSAYSPVVSRLILDFCKHKNLRTFQSTDVLEILKENLTKYYPENHVLNCNVLIDGYVHYNEKELLKTFLFEIDFDESVKNNWRFIQTKSNALANSLADFKEAIYTIKNYKDFEKNTDLIVSIIDLLIDSENFDEAQVTLDKYSDFIPKDSRINLQTNLLNYQEKVKEALDCYLQLRRKKYDDENHTINVSYYYLRNNEFEKAKRITKEFLNLENVNFNPQYAQIILNYEYAAHKLGGNYHKERITRVMEKHSSNKQVSAVCKYFLGKKSEALEDIKDYLTNHYSRVTTMIHWAVFEDIKDDLLKIKERIKNY